MTKRYTESELAAIGMDEKQIRAIMATYDQEDADKVVKMVQEPEKKNIPIPAAFGDKVPINCTEAANVTSIEDLQQYAKGALVRFPDFAEGQPFVARVRRPSMLVLAKQGRIPNTLLTSANELFTKGGSGMDADNENMLADFYSIMEIICEASLKEPTYQQIKDAGLELSDDQLTAIFSYAQSGVKALESFR